MLSFSEESTLGKHWNKQTKYISKKGSDKKSNKLYLKHKTFLTTNNCVQIKRTENGKCKQLKFFNRVVGSRY